MTDAPVLDVGLTAVHFRREAGVLHLELVGEIDIEAAPRLQATLEWVLISPPADIVVNLARTTFLDSTALRFFVRLRKIALGNERKISILTPPHAVASALHASGLDRVFNVTPAPH